MILLTPRERQLLAAIAGGGRDADFAAEHRLSVLTVRDYHKTLYWRLGARSGGHAVAVGYRHGLLAVPCGTVPVATPVLADLLLVAGAVARGNLRPDMLLARRAVHALGLPS